MKVCMFGSKNSKNPISNHVHRPPRWKKVEKEKRYLQATVSLIFSEMMVPTLFLA